MQFISIGKSYTCQVDFVSSFAVEKSHIDVLFNGGSKDRVDLSSAAEATSEHERIGKLLVK